MFSYFKFFITILYLSIFSLGYSNPNNGIKLVTFDSIYYISASDFCSINNYDCPVYTDKSKIKINFLKGPAIFSINSSFINFNNQVYHMTNKVKLQDNEFYIPINSFIRFCNDWNLQQISTSIDKMEASIQPPNNIFGYTIEESDQDYIITIFSDIDFNKNKPKISLLESNKLKIILPNGISNPETFKDQQVNNDLSVLQTNNKSIVSFQSELTFNEYSYNIISEGLKIRILKPQRQHINDPKDWEINTIIIDPGHGGKDPGAIGYHNIKEKHIVLDISKELGDLIKKNMPNMKIIYTRENDTFLGLKNRTSIANKNNGHIFISIHANSSSAKSARGYEIFLLQPNSVDEAIDVAIRENASIAFEDNKDQYEGNQIIATLAQNAFLKESEKLAVFIQAALKKELPKTRNRGIKQAGFHVLVGASMPNLLIEVGFLTNKSEAQLLNKSSYRAQIAHAIFKGVEEYVDSYNY